MDNEMDEKTEARITFFSTGKVHFWIVTLHLEE